MPNKNMGIKNNNNPKNKGPDITDSSDPNFCKRVKDIITEKSIDILLYDNIRQSFSKVASLVAHFPPYRYPRAKAQRVIVRILDRVIIVPP